MIRVSECNPVRTLYKFTYLLIYLLTYSLSHNVGPMLCVQTRRTVHW